MRGYEELGHQSDLRACQASAIRRDAANEESQLTDERIAMNRFTVVAVVLLLGSACTGGSPEEVARIEAAEDMEETVGDEAAMVGSNPDDMEGLVPPNSEETIEMESEPYPE